MEINFKSEFFKKIFYSESLNDKNFDYRTLSIRNDDKKKVEMTKEMQEDYLMILENCPKLEVIVFNNIPSVLVTQFMCLKLNIKKITMSDMSINGDIFRGVDENALGEIKELSFIACKGTEQEEDTQILRIGKFKNLRKIEFLNSAGLDVNELFEKIPQKENLKEIVLSDPLPKPEIIAEFTGLESINIQGVQNAKELRNFLAALPLEKIKSIDLTCCNMEEVSEDIISRLDSIEELEILNNTNADYNMFLEAIPNKNLMYIRFGDNNETKTKLNVEKLQEFKIGGLNLINVEIDYDELKKCIDQRRINILCLKDCGVENLDFLENSNLFNTTIEQEDIDFSILTPELAKKLKRISIIRTKTLEYIESTTFKIVNETKVDVTELKMQLNDTSLPEIEPVAAIKDAITEARITLTGSDISVIDEFVSKYGTKMRSGYDLFEPDFTKLDKEKIEILNKDNRLQHVIVLDKTCDDIDTPERYTYTPEQYLQLKELVAEITKGIEPDMPELKKFMIIYRRLGATIKYDCGIVGSNEYTKYANDNVDNSRNMINGLMRRTCVCAGYSDILYNCLREVGIEAFKISGNSHQWNKVKIDGVLYNVDLTWDAPELAKESVQDLEYCLVADKPRFSSSHKRIAGIKDECLETMPRNKVKEALAEAMAFDGIEPMTPIQKFWSKMNDDFMFKDALKEIKKDFKESIVTIKDIFRILTNRIFPRKKVVPKLTDSTNGIDRKRTKNSWEVSAEIKAQVGEVSKQDSSPVQSNGLDRVKDDE